MRAVVRRSSAPPRQPIAVSRTVVLARSELERRLEFEQRRVNATPTAARQLEAKLRRVMKEKVELENQLEAEQECIVIKLQKQLAQARERNECVAVSSAPAP